MRFGSLLVVGSVVLTADLVLAGTAAHAGDLAAGAISSPAIASTPPALGRATARRPIVDRIVPHGVTGDRIALHGFFTLPAEPGFTPDRRVHRRHHRRVAPATVVLAPPAVVSSAPLAMPVLPGSSSLSDYDGQPVDPSAGYAPPMVYTQPLESPARMAPPPPPAPTPNVVQYETGRFELRGDGMTTPYTWVWIPNPPPPPPAAPPPVASPGPRFSNDPPGRHGQLYRWTDEQGVVHLTDRLESVPRPYRVQAQQTPPS